MIISYFFVVIAAVVLAQPSGVLAVDQTETSRSISASTKSPLDSLVTAQRYVRYEPAAKKSDDEERGLQSFVKHIRELPARREWAKAEKLVKRHASIDDILKADIHPDIHYKVMKQEKLSEQGLLNKNLPPSMLQTFKKHRQYETRWKAEKGI
ncbi:unnamed protein product [Phytophthora lilii]|uniref:RxLR effector protein n=1 Tax=Phytophthora lilii TaxID=2077276 RepID=A0A9W6WZ10_9STRA|nr:unnamed protein product [Phytophthora lilii]